MAKPNSKRKTRSDKFPLTLHPTGQYCKKIKGKLYYFGTDNIYDKFDSELRKKVDFAVARTQPDKSGYRNFLIFQFYRWLKSMPEFEKLRAKAVKSLCREWHQRALPVIGTKPFDDTWADFVHG